MKELVYFAFVAVKTLITFTPKAFIEPVSAVIASFFWLLPIKRKKIVLRNLEIAFPNLSQKERLQIAKKVYKNFSYYFADMIKSDSITKKELEELATIKNEHFLKDAVASKKPLFIITAHFGNWEIPPKIIGANYTPMIVLMREFDHPKIGAYFKKSRNRFNIEAVNKKDALKHILKAFKKNKAVGALIDQHPPQKSNSIEVEFFQKKVEFNKSISLLAQKLQALVLPMFVYRENRKYIIEFLPPKEFSKEDTIQSFTQWQASIIEQMIKQHPSEYYWFHKRFKNIKGIYSNTN